MNKINSASSHFNDNWGKYQEAVNSNTLYHQEMTATLDSLLHDKFGTKPLSFVDAGCGDCSTIVPVLAKRTLSKFTGIDAAPDVLKLAEENCAPLSCEKQFICNSMLNAITELPSSIDVIYTSYAAHHLSLQEKTTFIQTCQSKLNPGGLLVMVDGILNEKQTRGEWMEELAKRIKQSNTLSQQELDLRMQHPRNDDFPEKISTFQQIAKDQHWKDFSVLFEKEIYAFMVFVK